MKSLSLRKRQHGVALVVALLFLLVVTVISLIAASNSSMGLKMSSNMADASISFQSAEAGVIAVVAQMKDTAYELYSATVDDGQNPFIPFEGIDPDSDDHPLGKLNDGAAAMDIEVFMTNAATACPRSATGSSVGLLDCDYYRIESEHDVSKKARTKVTLGAVKTIIGSGGT